MRLNLSFMVRTAEFVPRTATAATLFRREIWNTSCLVDHRRLSPVVLTVAHLNHTPEHSEDDNLVAMCWQQPVPSVQRTASRDRQTQIGASNPLETYSTEVGSFRLLATTTPADRGDGLRQNC